MLLQLYRPLPALATTVSFYCCCSAAASAAAAAAAAAVVSDNTQWRNTNGDCPLGCHVCSVMLAATREAAQRSAVAAQLAASSTAASAAAVHIDRGTVCSPLLLLAPKSLSHRAFVTAVTPCSATYTGSAQPHSAVTPCTKVAGLGFYVG
jgi:hypothetical protein